MKQYYRIEDIKWATNPTSTPEEIAAERERLLPWIDIEACDKFPQFSRQEQLFDLIADFYDARHHHVEGCCLKLYTEKDRITTHQYIDFHV